MNRNDLARCVADINAIRSLAEGIKAELATVTILGREVRRALRGANGLFTAELQLEAAMDAAAVAASDAQRALALLEEGALRLGRALAENGPTNVVALRRTV